MGLLWLTVRTFDGCFDRIPDRPPPQYSLRAVGDHDPGRMIGAGCLVGAIDCWIDGVEPGIVMPPFLGILAFSFMLAIGLVLIGAESARSGRPTPADFAGVRLNVAISRFVLGPMVAVVSPGPTPGDRPRLFASALATTHWTWHYQPQITKNSAGSDVISAFTLITTHVSYVGELPLGQRLKAAAVFIATILIHGGAAVSVGLALATVTEWSRPPIKVAVSIAALSALVLPVHLLFLDYGRPVVYAGGASPSRCIHFSQRFVTRTSFSLDETVVLVAGLGPRHRALAVGLSWCTIRHGCV